MKILKGQVERETQAWASEKRRGEVSKRRA